MTLRERAATRIGCAPKEVSATEASALSREEKLCRRAAKALCCPEHDIQVQTIVYVFRISQDDISGEGATFAEAVADLERKAQARQEG